MYYMMTLTASSLYFTPSLGLLFTPDAGERGELSYIKGFTIADGGMHIYWCFDGWMREKFFSVTSPSISSPSFITHKPENPQRLHPEHDDISIRAVLGILLQLGISGYMNSSIRGELEPQI